MDRNPSATAAGEVVAFAVFEDELARIDEDDVGGDALLRFAVDVAGNVFRRRAQLRRGFAGGDEARLDGFDEEAVADLLPTAVRGVVKVEAQGRVGLAVDAHFNFALAVQAAVFFVLPVGFVDEDQVVVAVLLVADGLAAPVAADAGSRRGQGAAGEEQEGGQVFFHLVLVFL